MIPVLSLRGAKGKQQPPPANNKTLPTPAPKQNSAPPPPSQQQQQKQGAGNAAKKEETLVIPTMALRGNTKPQQQKNETVVSGDKNQTSSLLLPTTTIQKQQQPQKSSVVAKPATKKKSSPSIVRRIDAQCHAMNCLANLSFRMASRSQVLKNIDDAEIGMNAAGGLSSIVLNVLKRTNEEETTTTAPLINDFLSSSSSSSFLPSRSKQARAFSHKLGKTIVRTALKRTHRRKIRKSKIAKTEEKSVIISKSSNKDVAKKNNNTPATVTVDPKLAKFQRMMQQNKDQMMSISGTRKRERTVKHKKSKRQDGEIDRRILRKLFCLRCGKPKLQGCGFRVMKWRKKSRIQKAANDDNAKSTQQQQEPTKRHKNRHHLLIKCISCSRNRQDHQLRQKLKKLFLQQNGRKPSSLLRLKMRQRYRKVLNRKAARKNLNSPFSVRGNKNMSLVTAVDRNVNLMKNWVASSGKLSEKIRIRRVGNREVKKK